MNLRNDIITPQLILNIIATSIAITAIFFAFTITLNTNYSVSIEQNAVFAASEVTHGLCGAHDGGDFSTAPAGVGLCDEGTPSSVTQNGGNWEWTCDGIGGTETVSLLGEGVVDTAITTFTTNTSNALPGDTITITWDTVGDNVTCSAVTLSGTDGGWAGSRGPSGSFDIVVDETSQYEITCTGDYGTDTRIIGVVVEEPILNIDAVPSSGPFGSNIVWSATGVLSCELIDISDPGTILQSDSSDPISGTFETGTLNVETTYRLTCQTSSGTETRETTAYPFDPDIREE